MLSEEQLLLTRAEAHRLLRSTGRTVLQVVRCTPDAILYLGHARRPMTAWLWREANELELQHESGWPAEPGRPPPPNQPDQQEHKQP